MKTGALGFQKEELVQNGGVPKTGSGLRKIVVILARDILEAGEEPEDHPFAWGANVRGHLGTLASNI